MKRIAAAVLALFVLTQLLMPVYADSSELTDVLDTISYSVWYDINESNDGCDLVITVNNKLDDPIMVTVNASGKALMWENQSKECTLDGKAQQSSSGELRFDLAAFPRDALDESARLPLDLVFIVDVNDDQYASDISTTVSPIVGYDFCFDSRSIYYLNDIVDTGIKYTWTTADEDYVVVFSDGAATRRSDQSCYMFGVNKEEGAAAVFCASETNPNMTGFADGLTDNQAESVVEYPNGDNYSQIEDVLPVKVLYVNAETTGDIVLRVVLIIFGSLIGLLIVIKILRKRAKKRKEAQDGDVLYSPSTSTVSGSVASPIPTADPPSAQFGDYSGSDNDTSVSGHPQVSPAYRDFITFDKQEQSYPQSSYPQQNDDYFNSANRRTLLNGQVQGGSSNKYPWEKQ